MPTAPIGVKSDISIKYHDSVDDEERFLQYPLKEITSATLEEETSDLFPPCRRFQSIRMADPRSPELTVNTQSLARNAAGKPSCESVGHAREALCASRLHETTGVPEPLCGARQTLLRRT